MKGLLCVFTLLIAKSLGRVDMPIVTGSWESYGKWNNPWVPRDVRRPTDNRPLRASTRNVRDVCGVASNSRIINGVDAEPNEFPWLVALLNNKQRFCTGSLISEQWVLTAAHCADGVLFFDVLLGAHNILAEETGRLEIRATEIHVHPSWNPMRISGDLALIKLPQTVDITEKNVRPICLQSISDARDFVGARVQLAGWGKTSDAVNQKSPTLQKTQTVVIDNQTCNQKFPGLMIMEDIMCTSGVDSGICFGDSGSGMSIVGADGRWTQIGVASFVSNAGCQSGKPNGFTRLREYLPWILSVTGIAL